MSSQRRFCIPSSPLSDETMRRAIKNRKKGNGLQELYVSLQDSDFQLYTGLQQLVSCLIECLSLFCGVRNFATSERLLPLKKKQSG